ncbi:hypothetical protein U0Q88_005060 [Lactiplantibacillus plantarum]|uniref:hypothetical protein n=1 Tax=Lactiplantibacillus plantarum TaxID=1590 RepID=UPI000D1FF271|nr:hypothetical protein [Lactiplantibacillus plantarum]AVV98137.1 hypothetical protein DA080_02555 [Lactiplantibacillus plantarum]AVW06683.1 hypothetical protein DA076_02500 [Lactiplantibacillus plantarum]MCC9314018.1 hypothetical protein [Lactiplantibacillus plantarum]MDF3263207.1 hypothetical protein [Lactiplantibacillus plantarum]MDO1603467.1 hypothetical protein [Lactiplantibacillus plantarum]
MKRNNYFKHSLRVHLLFLGVVTLTLATLITVLPPLLDSNTALLATSSNKIVRTIGDTSNNFLENTPLRLTTAEASSYKKGKTYSYTLKSWKKRQSLNKIMAGALTSAFGLVPGYGTIYFGLGMFMNYSQLKSLYANHKHPKAKYVTVTMYYKIMGSHIWYFERMKFYKKTKHRGLLMTKNTVTHNVSIG